MGSGSQAGSGGQVAANTQSGQGRSGAQTGTGRPQGIGGQSVAGRQSGSGQQQDNRRGQGNLQGQKGWGGQGGNVRQRMGMVCVKQGNLLIPRRVKTGISDNSFTEVEGMLKEGDELITGIVNTNPGQQTTQQQSPFAPQMGRPPQPAGGARGGR